MRIWIAVLASSATLFLGTSTRADDDKPTGGGPDHAGLFAKLDADQDGQLTADEAGQEHRRLFDRLMRNADQNADGKLSQEEFVAGLKAGGPGRGDRPDGPPGNRPRRERGDRPDGPPEGRRGGGRFGQIAERLREFDKNGDGKIELDEVPEERQQMFEMVLDRFDKNDDDAMDLNEIAEAAREFGQAGGRGPAGGPGPAGAGPGSDGPPGPPPLLVALDADGDGTLSAQEIENASSALQRLDKNGDGRLTRNELMPPPPGAGRTFSRDRGPDAPGNPEQLVRRLMNGDKNGDGKLQKEELPERMRQRFDRMDANGDGALDADELKNAAERLQRRMRENDDASASAADNAGKPAQAKKKDGKQRQSNDD
ncbi:MAG: EF-hand domain-containing protein [Pirellulales bacterium]|nr:EF-hand domain-containing protein [Pirellulales bacterium]